MSGIEHLKEFQPEFLAGLVDQSMALREENPSFGQRFLPNETIYSDKFMYDIVKKTKHLASFIGYGAEPPVMDRDAVADKSGQLAAFGLQHIATVEELMALNQARNEGEHNAMVEKLVTRTVDILNGMQDFTDVLRAKALTFGKLEYNDPKDGAQVTFDYQIPAEHKIALTGTSAWTDPSADAIGNLIEWDQTYSESNNGKQADVIKMPIDVFQLLSKNSGIIAEARPGTTATRVSTDEVNQVIELYNLPPIEIVRGRVTTVRNPRTGQDEAVEFYPAGRIVFLSEGLGKFFYGPNPESDDFTPGLLVRATDEKRPKRSIIEGYGAGFPVIEVPSLILHADVVE